MKYKIKKKREKKKRKEKKKTKKERVSTARFETVRSENSTTRYVVRVGSQGRKVATSPRGHCGKTGST